MFMRDESSYNWENMAVLSYTGSSYHLLAVITAIMVGVKSIVLDLQRVRCLHDGIRFQYSLLLQRSKGLPLSIIYRATRDWVLTSKPLFTIDLQEQSQKSDFLYPKNVSKEALLFTFNFFSGCGQQARIKKGCHKTSSFQWRSSSSSAIQCSCI